MKQEKPVRKGRRGSIKVKWEEFFIGAVLIGISIILIGVICNALNPPVIATMMVMVIPFSFALWLLYLAYLCDFHPS
ncbi:hypothetical protein A2Z00_00300 [Candidatus Gottesmanbacteria bacterium RBG_13_45_10]|uniref:Uncharacterized protein n=1 Tax=Candidatus Gottesmanbacteria bacterium RBG_13_45_10 TaxID=1798370 RepID=A0A1F5ZH87_9BACT|nr:MAG: hypothetical protein A2Z00_00300 [Candidatus Gottesmanbacteria bacterium RBG_13_45_10]